MEDIKIRSYVKRNIKGMSPDELRAYNSEVQKRWLSNNKEKKRLKLKIYYDANREKLIERQKIYNKKVYVSKVANKELLPDDATKACIGTSSC